MGARRGFEYLGLVNHQIERLTENGVLHQLTKRHLEPIAATRAFLCSGVTVRGKKKQHFFFSFLHLLYTVA